MTLQCRCRLTFLPGLVLGRLCPTPQGEHNAFVAPQKDAVWNTAGCEASHGMKARDFLSGGKHHAEAISLAEAWNGMLLHMARIQEDNADCCTVVAVWNVGSEGSVYYKMTEFADMTPFPDHYIC